MQFEHAGENYISLNGKNYNSPLPVYFQQQRQVQREMVNGNKHEIFTTVDILPKKHNIYEKRTCIEEKMNDMLLKKVCYANEENVGEGDEIESENNKTVRRTPRNKKQPRQQLKKQKSKNNRKKSPKNKSKKGNKSKK